MIVVSLSLDLLFDAPALLSRSTILNAPSYTECLRSLGAGPPAARTSPSLNVSRTVVPNPKRMNGFFPLLELLTEPDLPPQQAETTQFRLKVSSD